MTEEQEQALLREFVATCARLHAGFNDTMTHVAPLMPMTAERIDVLPVFDETLVLAFLKRFEQFEDCLQRTLKAISRIMELGKIERLTSRDVARRAWALGILADEKIWADVVRSRNALAHEYPLDPHKRTNQLNTAWDTRIALNTTWQSIQRFIEEEGLLP